MIGSFKFNKEKCLMAVLGPVRMDYEKAYAAINEVIENIK